MKYMLDIVLVIGLLVLGNMWNKERQNNLAQSDQIDKLNANVAQLQLDLGKAKDTGDQSAADLQTAKAQIEQISKDLQDKADALSAKTAEADELRNTLAAAVARVKELEGYKAKAIVAEMPKAIPAPAPAP